MKKMEITEELSRKVLSVVDHGLVRGLGKQILGQMCVEAAVCYALGLDHSDNPPCVAASVRSLKIQLNDSDWSTDITRSKGLRRIAVAQLGTKDTLDERSFVNELVTLVICKQVPIALRIAASVHPEEKHRLSLEFAAKMCETQKTSSSASSARDAASSASYAASSARYAANSASYAANSASYAASSARYAVSSASYAANSARYAVSSASYAASDKVLADFAEDVTQILKRENSPGSKFLYLCPL